MAIKKITIKKQQSKHENATNGEFKNELHCVIATTFITLKDYNWPSNCIKNNNIMPITNKC